MFFLSVSAGFAGFDDILKEVLLEDGGQRPIGSNEYIFNPGDAVIQKTNYIVYYAGYEVSSQVRILRFILTEGDRELLLTFPSPDIIQIRDVRLKVISFDNTNLRLQVLRNPQLRNYQG